MRRDYKAPHNKGKPGKLTSIAYGVVCPACGAEPGDECVLTRPDRPGYNRRGPRGGSAYGAHRKRLMAARAARQAVIEAQDAAQDAPNAQASTEALRASEDKPLASPSTVRDLLA